MSDFYEPETLVKRLRGIYAVWPVDLPERDFSPFIPPIHFEAARRIKELEEELDIANRNLDDAIYYENNN